MVPFVILPLYLLSYHLHQWQPFLIVFSDIDLTFFFGLESIGFLADAGGVTSVSELVYIASIKCSHYE